MNLSPPIPRWGRSREADAPATNPIGPANRTPVRSRSGAVRRERHDADYVILVVVVALSAIGILMVYSSSALKGYLAEDDTFATVGPQIQWAVLGIVAMLAMMRVDYRYLRLASVPMYIIAIVALALAVRPVAEHRGRRLRPLAEARPGLPAVHPAEFAKLALIVYLAHWFAKRGTRVGGLWSGTVPFLIIVAPIVGLVFLEPDLGHDRGHRPDRASRCSSSPAPT